MSDERTPPSTAYSDRFYARRHARSAYAARTVLAPLVEALGISSAIDFGCGVGSWLSVAKELGVDDVVGIEGPWVSRQRLEIAADELIEHDLGEPIDIGRRFDLAVSLEVAEHLPSHRAASFVAELCGAAGVVLFSAAVLGQGGRRHVNEQWQSFWAGLFDEQGYAAIDCIRPAIWSDVGIDWWYRQNPVLYAARTRLAEICRALGSEPVADLSGLDVVHPELLKAKAAKLDSRAALAERLVKLIFRRGS